MKLLFCILMACAPCAVAQEFVRFIAKEDVLLIEPGQPPIPVTMDRGDCVPLVRIDSRPVGDWELHPLYDVYAILKIAEAEFEVRIAQRDSYTKSTQDLHVIEKISSENLPAALASYRECVKVYRDALTDVRREQEAAAIVHELRGIQSRLDALH